MWTFNWPELDVFLSNKRPKKVEGTGSGVVYRILAELQRIIFNHGYAARSVTLAAKRPPARKWTILIFGTRAAIRAASVARCRELVSERSGRK